MTLKNKQKNYFCTKLFNYFLPEMLLDGIIYNNLQGVGHNQITTMTGNKVEHN